MIAPMSLISPVSSRIDMADVPVHAEIQRRVSDESGRVVRPAEWAVIDAVARHEGIHVKPGIPIPSGSVPTWEAVTTARYVRARIRRGSFGQRLRPDVAPSVETILPAAVEFLRMRHAGQRGFASLLHFHTVVASKHRGLPVVDSEFRLIRIELIESGLLHCSR